MRVVARGGDARTVDEAVPRMLVTERACGLSGVSHQ